MQKSRFDLVYGERIVTHEGRQHGRCKRIEVRFYIVVGVSVGHLYHVLHHLFVLAEGRFGKAHPFGDEAALFTHEFRPLDGRSRHRNDEVGGLSAAGQHVGDDAPFAVADNACGGRFGPCGEPAQGACRIGGEILQRGGGVVAFRSGRSAVVIAQDGDAVACQPVGQYEERFVAEELFVAVLCPRTGHEDNGGEGTFSGGQCQGSCKRDARSGVVECDLFRGVGEGRPGRLRPRPFRFMAREGQRQGEPSLPERSLQGIGGECAFVGHSQSGGPDGQGRAVEYGRRGLQSFGMLVGAVHDGRVSPFVFADMEDQGELLRAYFEGSVPVARNVLSSGRSESQCYSQERQQQSFHSVGVFCRIVVVR